MVYERGLESEWGADWLCSSGDGEYAKVEIFDELVIAR